MNNQFENQLKILMQHSKSISENTELYKYIKQINDLCNSDGVTPNFGHKYDVYRSMDHTDSVTFLSVVLRTQGNRPLGLREAMLSLRAQSNQNFEVIVIAHKATNSGKSVVKEILEDQPDSFKEKIKYIELDEGTRTTPINVGCFAAVGQYIAVFDDDDLLFDNWVEKFHEAAQDNYGKILHAFVLAQKWEASENGYMAAGAPTSQFCCSFDLLSQLVVNKCPLMGLAFPSFLFHELGIVFNESLNVTEDWEYFMRVVPITGVVDIDEPTSIYRLWVNAENSYTIHSEDTWIDTYNTIQTYMDQRMLLLPRGYTKHVVSLIRRVNDENNHISQGYPRLYGLLYYGTSMHFSDERMINSNNKEYLPQFQMEFNLPNTTEHFSYFRFDPCEFGGLILRDIHITLLTEKGQRIPLSLTDCTHNGMNIENGIYFMHYDPQIVWRYSGEHRIIAVSITGSTKMEIPEHLISAAIGQTNCTVIRFISKVKNKIIRVGKKLFNH